MAFIHNDRHTASLTDDEEVVVFLIGMRINHLWQLWRWVPVAAAMPRMLRELAHDRSLGLLGTPRTFVSGRVIEVQQYWRSFEDLERYAHSSQHQHLPAWRRFNKRIGGNGSVGIFHETYVTSGATSECLAVNMPSFGMVGAVGSISVGRGRQSAAERIGRRAGGDMVDAGTLDASPGGG